jgi:predicted ester cyclase
LSGAATLAQNRAIGRRVLLELWGEGNLALADELYAPNYIDHVGSGPEPSRVSGPDGIKQGVTLFRTAFPDLAYTVEDEMAERDLVLTRFSARGTNLGPFLGHAPTGRVVTYSGFDMNRIAGSRIVESWVSYDALGLLQQLGLVPTMQGL